MRRDTRSKGPIDSSGPFLHVLVPTDLTERAERALATVSRLALPETSQITLLHVVETIEGMHIGELKGFYARLERRAKTAMTRQARRAGKGVRVTTAITFGRRAEEIVDFAAANGVDLIVLASHRVNRSRANRDWGTISYKVGIHAQCSVLLVK